MEALARGGPPSPRDLLEVAKFQRFLREVGHGPIPPEWEPYAAGTGDPPAPPIPAHGGYPGDVLVSRRDLFSLTLGGEKVGGLTLEIHPAGGHWSAEAADYVVEPEGRS